MLGMMGMIKEDTTYLDRWKLVRELGFENYKDYLQSELWSRIRSRVLKKANGKCAMCESRARQIHHVKYTSNNISGKSLEHMLASCDECHELIHLDRDRFVPQQESEKRVGLFVESKKRDVRYWSITEARKKSKSFKVQCCWCRGQSHASDRRSMRKMKCQCGGWFKKIK